jgi:hypothetical protein
VEWCFYPFHRTRNVTHPISAVRPGFLGIAQSCSRDLGIGTMEAEGLFNCLAVKAARARSEAAPRGPLLRLVLEESLAFFAFDFL